MPCVFLKAGVFEQKAQVGEDGEDNHAGHAVSHGDEPEGRGADGLLRGQALGLGGRGAASGPGGRGSFAVGTQADVFGTVADDVGQGQGHGENDDGQNQGDALPADDVSDAQGNVGEGHADAAVDAQVNQGDDQQGAAAAHKVGPAHGRGHAAGEPVVDGGHHGHPTAHPLPQGHDQIGRVEHIQRRDGPVGGVDLPEDEEAEAEDEEANQHHLAAAELVGEVALDGPHQAALDAREGQSQRQLAAGPAEVVFQGHGPEGHGVEQRHRGNRHHEAGGEDDVPAVEDVRSAEAHNAGYFTLFGGMGIGDIV